MAWVSVKETFNQLWSDNTTGQQGTRIYLVVSDTKILDNDAVLLANDGSNSIPSIGDAWSISKSGVTVVDRKVKELDNGKLFFQVTVQYESPTGSGTSGSDDPDPLARPWDISTSTLKEERNIEKTRVDVSGLALGDINLGNDKSIVNAASDPLEVRGFHRKTVITMSKNYSDFSDIHATFSSLEDLKVYEGSLNDDTGAPITIAGISDNQWTFLIDEINVANARENETDYIRVTYRVIHDRETHIEILLNAGFNKIVDDGGSKKRVPITRKGVPVKKPALLTATGGEVAATDPATAVASGTYIAAGIDPEIDFAKLSFPTSFN